MDKIITTLDGTIEQQTNDLKAFLNLTPEQTFQDIEVDEDD